MSQKNASDSENSQNTSSQENVNVAKSDFMILAIWFILSIAFFPFLPLLVIGANATLIVWIVHKQYGWIKLSVWLSYIFRF